MSASQKRTAKKQPRPEHGAPLDAIFELDYEELAWRVNEVPTEIYDVLLLFDGHRTLAQVLEVCPFPDVDTLRAFFKAKAEALLVDVTTRGVPAREESEQVLLAWLAEGDRPGRRRRRALRWLGAGAVASAAVVGALVAGRLHSRPPATPSSVAEPAAVARPEEKAVAPALPAAVGAVAAAPIAAPVAAAPAPVAAEPVAAVAVPAPAAPAPVAAAPVPVAAAPAPVAAAPVPVAAAPAPVAAAPAPVAAAPVPVAAAAIPAPAAPAPAVAAPDAAARYQTLVAEARTKHARGKTKAAMAALDEAIALDPQGWEALVELARCQLDQGATARALGSATRAAGIHPDAADAYLVIGAVRQQDAHDREARVAYEKYLALAPKGQYAGEIRAVLRSLH